MFKPKLLLATIFAEALASAPQCVATITPLFLPSPILFTSKQLAPSTKLLSLLTCIETQAKRTRSPEDFLFYASTYNEGLKQWQPFMFIVMGVDTPKDLYFAAQAGLQGIVNAIANNPMICAQGAYLNELITVIIGILDLFSLDIDLFPSLFDCLEDVCSKEPLIMSETSADNGLSKAVI